MRPKLPDPVTMLRALIGAPSVSSVSPAFDQSNRAVVELLADWMEDLGFVVEVMPIPGFAEKFNLVATLGRGPGGLVLAGHTDTVPFDTEGWRFDPFTLTEADGCLYGLGTSDMKGFFPLAIEAARRFDGERLRAPLILVATADEESSMCGARALVDAGRPHARFAVVGEPTGMRPVRLHKGVMMEAIRLTGRAGHSSDPSLGINALEAMYQVMGELLTWRAELQAAHNNPLFTVPVPTLNLGHIHGGDNPNRICGECELHFDLRPLPGMDPEELRVDIAARVNQRLAGSGIKIDMHSLFPGMPPMDTPSDSPVVRAAETLTGYTAEAAAFGTEGPYLARLGMDTVILGPGDIAQAHQPDEFLRVDRISPTIDLLASLIERFCTQPPDTRAAV